MYGQSNRFDWIGFGTSTVMPPISSITFLNWLKSTIAMWLTCRLVSASTVLIASAGPPNWYAALMRFCPCPGMST